MKPEHSVLVQGGAGGVGGFAVQLAAWIGASVLTTASGANFDFVQGLGAQTAIDYHEGPVNEAVMTLTAGRGVDRIVDAVSSATATEGLSMLAFGGEMACIAGMPDMARLAPPAKAVSVHKVMLGGAYLAGDRQAQVELAEIGMEMMRLLVAGKISSMVNQVVSLEEVPAGLKSLAGRHVRGKIVATVT